MKIRSKKTYNNVCPLTKKNPCCYNFVLGQCRYSTFIIGLNWGERNITGFKLFGKIDLPSSD